ncbi:hypothetical protein [Roseateles sp. P5_E7]
MNDRLLVIVALLATALLAACDAQYRDISSNPDQRADVGQVCDVASDLRAHGVALSLEHEWKTDHVSIWNPGFTGPEMTFLVVLKPGTKLRVLAVRECSNCILDRMLEYQVEVSPEPPQFAGKPAYLRAESKTMPHVRCPRSNAA